MIEKFLERSIGVSAATIFEIISTRYVGDSSISEAKIVVDVFRTLFSWIMGRGGLLQVSLSFSTFIVICEIIGGTLTLFSLAIDSSD